MYLDIQLMLYIYSYFVVYVHPLRRQVTQFSNPYSMLYSCNDVSDGRCDTIPKIEYQVPESSSGKPTSIANTTVRYSCVLGYRFENAALRTSAHCDGVDWIVQYSPCIRTYENLITTKIRLFLLYRPYSRVDIIGQKSIIT